MSAIAAAVMFCGFAMLPETKNEKNQDVAAKFLAGWFIFTTFLIVLEAFK